MYTLIGENLDMIPEDAVGLYALSNAEPLSFINTTDETLLYDVKSVGSGRLELVAREVAVHGVRNYLGAIVSNDRQTIYWVNNTRPLP